MTNVILLLIAIGILIILFAIGNEESRKTVCWFFILASIVAVILFFVNPHLVVTGITKP